MPRTKDPASDAVFVTLVDERRDDQFQISVDAAVALDAFHHPYAYDGRGSDERVVDGVVHR